MPMSEPKILVVDDQLINIRLLERKLSRSGMQVISATNGPDAIRMTSEENPDVVLLDIMMPGMSGIDVCRHLKEQAQTREIPIIFITAQTSKEGKIEGLDVGAADYLIKPIDLDETIARVRTQLRIVQEHRENLRLTRELEQSRRQASIMHLTEGIAHNLNNLLGVMVGYTSLLRRNKDEPEKILQNSDRLEAAIKRMTRIVHQLTVIGHFKSLQRQLLPLHRILEGAIFRFQRVSGTSLAVAVENPLAADFVLNTNKELLEGALERVLQNAYESYGDKDATEMTGTPEIGLWLQLAEQGGTQVLKIHILDRGRGVAPELRDSIFEPFVTSSSVIGRGMGLTIARHSVHCLGGTIAVHDRAEGGTRVEIVLPIDPEESLNDG